MILIRNTKQKTDCELNIKKRFSQEKRQFWSRFTLVATRTYLLPQSDYACNYTSNNGQKDESYKGKSQQYQPPTIRENIDIKDHKISHRLHMFNFLSNSMIQDIVKCVKAVTVRPISIITTFIAIACFFSMLGVPVLTVQAQIFIYPDIGSPDWFSVREDGSGPQITNVQAVFTDINTLQISWQTDVQTTSVIEYATREQYLKPQSQASNNYPFSNYKEDETYTTNHTITLSNLIPNETYYYMIRSIDQYFIETNSIIKNISPDTTNCKKFSGDGPIKVVFVKGKNWNSSIGNFVDQINNVINYGFKTIDPFRSYSGKFSYYLDLKEVDEGLQEKVLSLNMNMMFPPAVIQSFKLNSSCNSSMGITNQYLFYLTSPDNQYVGGENCSTKSSQDFRGLDNKVYGSKNMKICNVLSDSIDNQKLGGGNILRFDYNNKFNVIDCGYIIAGLKGESTTKDNAQKYWPECMKMDTVKDGIPPVNPAPTIRATPP